VSQIKLSDDVAVDAGQIKIAKLIKKGAKTGTKALSLSSQALEEVTAPEDELIVHLLDGAEFAIRGEQEVKSAWDELTKARSAQKLNFPMNLLET